MSKRDEMQRAADLWEQFSGMPAEVLDRVPLPPQPRVAVLVGYCDRIDYTTMRDNEVQRYRHRFAESDRPLLLVSPDGDQLLLYAGDFRFTDRGITDASGDD